jgi:hypothetical protein
VASLEPTYYGSVYELSASGTESILYAFGGGNDGDSPYPGVSPEKH